MRFFLICFFCLASSVLADVPKPETLEETLGIMADAYRETGAFESVEIDAADQSLKLTVEGRNDAFTSYPDNLHKLLSQTDSEDERGAILEDFVKGVVETAERIAAPPERDPSIILPLIRSSEFAEDASGGRISTPLAGDLSVFYAFDYPQTFAFLTEEDLAALGLDLKAVGRLAWENFTARGWEPELRGEGIWMLTLDGNFEATYLLDSAMWRGFDEQLGTVLMMALARDLILFTDGDLDGAEAEIRRIAAENFDKMSYPLSQTLFQWTGDGWAVR